MSKEQLIGKILEANETTVARVAQVLDGTAPDEAQLLTLEEARKKLSVSRTTMWQLEKAGALHPVILPVGGKRYTLDDVKKLMVVRAR